MFLAALGFSDGLFAAAIVACKRPSVLIVARWFFACAVRAAAISSRRSGSGASPVGAGVASSALIALCIACCAKQAPFGQPLLEAAVAAARKASLRRSTPFGNRRRFHIAFVHCLPTVCYST